MSRPGSRSHASPEFGGTIPGQRRLVLVFQHVPFETPAAITSLLRARGFRVEIVRLWLGDPIPLLDRYDLLVVMGGPMGVYDTQRHPWLVRELASLERVLSGNVPVLGICLGAQLIAAALGARVYPGAQKEIGWWPVEFDVSGDGAPLPAAVRRFPARATVFHWHGDTFDLPPGAIRFASTPVTANQAFVVGRNVVGLQFHLESTAESVAALVEAGADEIGEGTYQPDRRLLPANLVRAVRTHGGTTRRLLADLLDDLTSTTG